VAAEKRMGDFNLQEITNTASALAVVTVGHKDEQLFSMLAAAAKQHMRHFTSKELASTAWSFATVSDKDELLFTALAAAAQPRVSDFNSQCITNTAAAFAQVGHKDEQLF